MCESNVLVYQIVELLTVPWRTTSVGVSTAPPAGPVPGWPSAVMSALSSTTPEYDIVFKRKTRTWRKGARVLKQRE